MNAFTAPPCNDPSPGLRHGPSHNWRPFLTLIMAMSVNGIISRAADESVSTWSSAEDKAHLDRMIAQHKTVITGRESFAATRSNAPSPHKPLKDGVRYYVLTHDEALWRKSAPPVTYLGGTAEDVLRRMKAEGVDRAALLGGPRTNAAFLNGGYVDEMFLTIEPALFCTGRGLCEGLMRDDLALELLSAETLNPRGTLLLHYKALWDSPPKAG